VQALALLVVEAIVSKQHDVVELRGGHEVELGAVRQVRWLIELDAAVLDADFGCVHGFMGYPVSCFRAATKTRWGL
jgi:hypothetical protein